MNALRIALLVPDLSNTAPTQVAKELACQYLAAGHAVDVFYFKERIECEFPCKSYRIKLLSLSDFSGYDIVHSHMLHADLHLRLNRIGGRNRRPKFVSTIHNMVEEDMYFQHGRLKSILYSRLWRWAWNVQDSLVVLTKAAKSYYSGFMPGRATTIICNGRTPSKPAAVSAADESEITALRERYKVIGACALLTHRKGLDQMIKALPYLPGWALTIVGDGPARQDLERLCREQGVSDRCVFFGFRHNAQSYLQHFDLYCMPSRSEGLPLALLEAAAHKKAIVCSDIAAFKEIFSDLEVSYFRLESIGSLADAVRHADGNREDLARAASMKYESTFTAKRMADNYLHLFESLLSAENGAGKNASPSRQTR